MGGLNRFLPLFVECVNLIGPAASMEASMNSAA